MDKKLLGLLSIFFLAFTLFASLVIFNQPINQLTRAKEETDASPDDTLIIAWPLTIPADNKTQSSITVFVRNLNGGRLANKNVSVSSTLGTIKGGTVLSDKDTGKAEFQFTCDTPGLAELEAVVDNTVKVKNNISIKCNPL